MISPITLLNLKPCPEKPAANDTCGHAGCAPMMKFLSGELVNMQTAMRSRRPAARGKQRRRNSRSISSSSVRHVRSSASGSARTSVSSNLPSLRPGTPNCGKP